MANNPYDAANTLEHVYTFLPSHNERKACCALPEGTPLLQSDEFTLPGNPYPNQNQLPMRPDLTWYSFDPYSSGRYVGGCGGLPSLNTMWRLQYAAGIQNCPPLFRGSHQY